MIKNLCRMIRSVAGVLIMSVSFAAILVVPCHAAMVGTEVVLNTRDADSARRTVLAYLDREAVTAQLESWAVPAHQARARVNAMTDEEVQLLAQRIETAPAGGIDTLTAVTVVALVSFITLVVTDVLGITDVFPFIKKR